MAKKSKPLACDDYVYGTDFWMKPFGEKVMGEVDAEFEVDNGEPDVKRRGRPVGARNKPKRVRRNYQAELADLDRRVATAMRLLARCVSRIPADGEGVFATVELIQTAMDELRERTE